MSGMQVPAEAVSIGRPSMLSLQVGKPRRFGLEDIGEIGLLSGWAPSEAGHGWNDGVDATLLVAVRGKPGPLDLELEVEPFVTRQNPVQELTLYMNGARAGFWRLDERRVTRLTAWIDPSWWRALQDRSMLRLVFHMPQSVTPISLGTCDDLRVLGFSFRGIGLHPSLIDA